MKTIEETVAVFVYGTLKKGYGNDRLVRDLVEHTEIALVEGYTLLDLGAFPGAVQLTTGYVVGELLTLRDPKEALRRLDRLEGHPNFYRRTKVRVLVNDGHEQDCWIYVYQNAHRRSRTNPIGCEWPAKRQGSATPSFVSPNACDTCRVRLMKDGTCRFCESEAGADWTAPTKAKTATTRVEELLW